MMVDVNGLLSMERNLLDKQNALYHRTIENFNIKYNDLLKSDLGAVLVKNCAFDIAGEIVRRFMDATDYYISVDQIISRIINFSYDNDIDPLNNVDESIRKNLYYKDEDILSSSLLKSISNQAQKAQRTLFEKETVFRQNRKTGAISEKEEYKDKKIMETGKNKYREIHSEAGEIKDEISGISKSETNRIEVDHVQSAAAAMYNSMYINSEEGKEALKVFYNSEPNFQMLEKSANGSKGDVRVFSDDKGNICSSVELNKMKKEFRSEREKKYKLEGLGKEEIKEKVDIDLEKMIGSKYKDVTYKATAKQQAQAICDRWENANERTKARLIETGKLDENGKVKPEVRKRLENNLKKSMEEESKIILQYMNKNELSQVALNNTRQTFTKIITGQIIYYFLPPTLYEIKEIVITKCNSIDALFDKIKEAGKRIIEYVTSKLKNIVANISENSIRTFARSIFDILISIVKESVKRMIKIAKTLVMSLIHCVRIIVSKESTRIEKADAVTKILASSITGIIIDIIFEYIESIGIPPILLDSIQVICTVLSTNLVMVALEQADLFNIKYGLLINNIDKEFEKEKEIYIEESTRLADRYKNDMQEYQIKLNAKIKELREKISEMNIYEATADESLDEMNKIYDMGIDFDKEWRAFCAI